MRTPRESERDSAFLDYYRCPSDVGAIGTLPGVSAEDGYFRFGGSIGFGRFAGGLPAAYATDNLTDVSAAATIIDGRAWLPFDLSQVATNRRRERYRRNGNDLLQKTTSGGIARTGLPYFLE